MPYLKQKYAYKVVLTNFNSMYNVSSRDDVEHPDPNPANKRRPHGAILNYKPGTTVTSMNGLCTCKANCCRGIHAYRSMLEARYERGYGETIIKVKGKWWAASKNSGKVRAEKVEVIEELSCPI